MSLMVRLLVVLLALSTAVRPAAAEALPPSQMPGKVERIDNLVQRFLHPSTPARNAPPAISVAVSIEGQLALAKGYGEAQAGMRADANTLYHIGSLTKQFTAAAVLDLIARKAITLRASAPLTLETEADAIFDGVEHWHASQGNSVTVRRLLNMTSNLPNFTRRPPAAADPWGAIAAPALLGELKRLVPWGWPDSFEYSNTSYFLLAAIMESVVVPGEAGPLRYRDRLRSSLFARAGMTGTGFIGEYLPGAVLAEATYRRRPVFAMPDWLKGSGDMASNVLDLNRWNTALMEGRIPTPWARDLMLSDSARVGPTEWYGMGWFIEHREGRDVFHHSGTVPGYTAFNAIARAGEPTRWVSVVLLANSDGISGLDELAEDIVDIALE